MEFKEYLNTFLDLIIKEDIGDGDHTSLACIPKDKTGKAKLLVKQDGILSGCEIAYEVIKKLDTNALITTFKSDGDPIYVSDVVFHVESNVQSLLQAERIVLNIMQRMSGIATQTSKYVKELEGLKTRVLGTRKTTPGMRLLEKQAIRHGGGLPHRIGLYDMIMIKDNHIDFAGGIEKAINNVKDYLKEKNKDLFIVCEVRSLEDIKKVIKTGGVDRILIDNFTIEQTRQAVQMLDGKITTESSGGITLSNLREYAECGVDYISVGALTHQISSLDLSLKAIDY